MYYAATPGSEDFPEIFTYKPLLCSLKQLTLKKVTKENISRIAAIKNSNGKTLAELLQEKRSLLQTDLEKFSSGGSRGLAQLEQAIASLKSVAPN